MVGRRALGVAALLAAPSLPWLASLGACSTDGGTSGLSGDASVEASAPVDDAGPVGEDAVAAVFGDDANGGIPDAAAAALCPGSAVPEDATSSACAIDMSGSCPACASWGFVCEGWASPRMQDASAASFCRATETDAG